MARKTSSARKTSVPTPRPDLFVVRVGKRAERPPVAPEARASHLVGVLYEALKRPGIDRSTIFRAAPGKRAYAYYLDPADSSRIVREDESGARSTGHLVNGRLPGQPALVEAVAMARLTPPSAETFLKSKAAGAKPLAIVLAGHNGSGKSTLWYQRLADQLQMPLVNADRLTLSLLPQPDRKNQLKPWAVRLRDSDQRYQRLAQDGVNLFMGLAMDQRMPFAFETVFSHLKPLPDGGFESKIDVIRRLQQSGYYVILIFVGLASVEMSIFRVLTRKNQGGHDVPEDKLRSRFPRTQQAIGMAAQVADLTLMFDNSRDASKAFGLARVQQKKKVLYDCRDATFEQDAELVRAASLWLRNVAPQP